LAHSIHPVVKVCDIVIDIHSTETNDPGSESSIIVTKFDKDTRDITDVLHPPRVLVMDYTKSNALISDARIGIGFEYGKNNHPDTLRLVTRDIKRLLVHLGMINEKTKEQLPFVSTRYYRVFGVLSKEVCTTIDPTIRNYTPVSKNQPIGIKDDIPFLAPCDFIPILFGNNRYKEIFGFMGKEI
jgi:hypothetical protein